MTKRVSLLSAAVAANLALLGVAAGLARAQTVYPERVIKMIVPSPAGGQTDVMARLMAQKMQQALGQSVIIDNRAPRPPPSPMAIPCSTATPARSP
jgi:tripartite-type tricarboxylate transporter receptor subunit TctC